jgi:hypothetical protein
MSIEMTGKIPRLSSDTKANRVDVPEPYNSLNTRAGELLGFAAARKIAKEWSPQNEPLLEPRDTPPCPSKGQ